MVSDQIRSYDLMFDLDGGTYNGSDTLVITSEYGRVVTLPAPTKEGFEFDYWESSKYNAGDEYTVSGEHSFKAVWKEAEKGDDKEDDVQPDDKGEDVQPDEKKKESDSHTSGGAAAAPVTDSVITCHMAGYPSNYVWNEAVRACQPGFLDDAGNFHAEKTVVKKTTVPDTADKNTLVYAWLMMLSVTSALFCGVKLVHEDWEV